MSAPEKDGKKELQRLLSQEVESEILRQELARFLCEELSPRQLLEALLASDTAPEPFRNAVRGAFPPAPFRMLFCWKGVRRCSARRPW
jgi:hypothetical protein